MNLPPLSPNNLDINQFVSERTKAARQNSTDSVTSTDSTGTSKSA